MNALQVWEIDGEDLIVARSVRHMQKIYSDYHMESIRGREQRMISPESLIELVDDDDKTCAVTAQTYARRPGYFPASR